MWNPIKLGKSMYHLMTTYGEGAPVDYSKDLTGDDRLDHVMVIFRELRLPFSLNMVHKLRKKERGRDLLWGRRWNDKEYVENVVIPKLSDLKYLESLAPNTVGAHYANLVKAFGIEDIYNQRFKPEERGLKGSSAIAGFRGVEEDMRENLSRHLLLVHDIIHVLTRYDTSSIGEGMVQVYTSRLTHWWTPHVIGFGIAMKEILHNKNFDVWPMYKEALRQSKQVDVNMLLYSPIEFLEQDIQEVRDRFNIQVPTEYLKYARKYPGHVKLNTFHPEYDDIAWEQIDEVSI